MDSITLKYEVEPAEDPDEALYPGALTDIKAKVFYSGKEIGTIGGIGVDRQRIGENSFHVTFDEHSGDLEWIGSVLLENKYGRTKLQSLRDGGDDSEFNFFYIDTFCMDKAVTSDMATFALRKFLHGERIKGNLSYGCWINSSVAYALEPVDSDGTQGKRKREDEDSNVYREIIPFLRNGFFQDTAIIGNDPENARILVGAVRDFEKNLISESEAKAKASRLQKGGGGGKKMKGSDIEILNLVRNLVNDNDAIMHMHAMQGVSSAMLGLTQYRPPAPPEDPTSEEQLRNMRQQIVRLQNSGGSVARSGAIHAACEKNSLKVVELLLQLDATSATAKDHPGRTPLIVAGINASGRLSINGIDDTAVIDALLNAGAQKADVDSSNMTAYGHFKRKSSFYLQMTHYEHRHKITDLEHKLYPSGGPSLGDFSEGRGGRSGLVDYGPEDDEADREMGRGKYADSEGDY